ncbi:MAG: halo transducer protein [Haloferacaceae archaeon]
MSDGDATDEGIAGLPVEDAVDAVLEGDDGGHDRDAVRTALGHVTADGAVSRDEVDEALSEASMYVSTAETRTELASIELDEARAVAEPVADVDAVAARLDEFASRLRAVETRADALGDDLQALLDRSDEADLFDVATGIGEVRADAAGVQGAADELQVDVGEFKRWLVDPAVRYREFGGDVDALGTWLDELADAVETLAGGGDRPADGVDRAVVWFDAELHRRLLALLLADLRAELADLRTLVGRELDVEVEGEFDVDHEERLASLAAALDDHDARLAALGDRLDDLVRPAWRERFDDRLESFAAALEGREPPVDWGELQAAFERHRPTGEGAA